MYICVLGSSARFVRATGYRIILREYVTQLCYGIIVWIFITGIYYGRYIMANISWYIYIYICIYILRQ